MLKYKVEAITLMTLFTTGSGVVLTSTIFKSDNATTTNAADTFAKDGLLSMGIVLLLSFTRIYTS